MSDSFSDVALAVQALEESLQSEDIRNLPWSGASIPTPMRQVLRAVEAGMNAVNRDEESVVAMLQHLRQHLEHPHASELLLSLFSSTFLLAGGRVEELLGAKTPLTLKRWILQALVREIDLLWGNFGQLLLQRLKTFLKGFRWLDKDESGAFGQTEFVRAYMELCMQAGAAESAEGFKFAYESQLADAGFLFQLLAGSSAHKVDNEVGVSLYNLVLRIVGVQDQELTTFRRQVYSHYPNIEACFAAHAPKDATSADLNAQQFLQLGAWLRQFDEKFRHRALQSSTEDEVADVGQKQIRVSAELEKRFHRFFRGLDINCSGALSVTEVKQAFAEVAPALPSSSVRRRIVLAYGSLRGLVDEMKRSADDSESEIEIETGAAGRVQAEKFSELLELPTAEICDFLTSIEVTQASGKKKAKLPKDGTDYSLEELAISVFLCKPPDKDLEDLIADLHKFDRSKALSFEDFQRYVFRVPDDNEPLPWKPLAKSGSKPTKSTESKRASVRSTALVKPLWSSDGLLLAKYSTEQLRVVYDKLDQSHGSVTVNALISAFTNISDVMAIDRRRYNGGDRIVCRVRLGTETNSLCGKHPVVAVVPSRMVWSEEGGKSHWVMDGQKVTSFTQVGSLPHFLPPGSAGVRECTVWLTAPWTMTENRAFDVRVFASDSGRVPLRQVGGQVSFSVHFPCPAAPTLEQFGLKPGANSCSALLHWVAPVEEKYCPPILKHILHIEPMLSSTEQMLSNGDLKDLEVFNQHLRDLEKRKSIRVNDLQRGVPYRFAVQCVHQVDSAEVLGAVSDFSETVTMPFQPVPAQPGMPEVRAWQQTGKLEILEILLPVDVDFVDRFCCYDIEYRKEGKIQEGKSEESENLWTRIPDNIMHMNHDAKWDERLNGYCFSCLLIGPKPVIEERDSLEFRVRSTNTAGSSPWSPSASIKLGSAKDQGDGDAEQTELELTALDLFTAASAVLAEGDAEAESKPAGNGKAALTKTLTRGRTQILENPKMPLTKTNLPKGPRTHCRIQWQLEEGQEISYQVEVREERLPFYAAWTPLPAYYRYNAEDKVGEVFVSGLETFPAAEPLILRMLKGSGKQGVCATVRLHGVAGPPAPPTLQLARTLTAPGSELPVAELMWHEKEPLKEVKTLIEACWELENSLKTEWSQLTTAQPIQLDDGEDGLLNICFVQLQSPNSQQGGTRCSLRMRYEGPDGQRGEASAETDAVQLMDAMQSAKAAQEFLRRSTIKKVKAPRRPQQLTIIGGSKSLWEVSWEQKGKSEKVPIYEAEVCVGTAGLEPSDQDWQPVRGLYVQQMEEGEGEKEGKEGSLRLVTAAVGLPHDLPTDKAWRLRVRCEGGDWSAPTAWQEPGVVDFELPLPGQPSVRSNAFTFGLQWEVSGHWTLIQHLQYEVQVQARKRRGSSKFSDWIALTTYYTISDQVSENVTIVKALVERAAASEAVKASFGYEELRFRVRAMSASGVSAPSEPSETEMLVITQPASQQPPLPPDVLGKGSVLWEDEKNKSLFQSALIQVSFPKPPIDLNELNEGLPPLEYKLEAQFGSQMDESDWKQIDRTMVFVDESTNMVTALVPTLDEDADEADELDFELAENESRVSFARRLHPTEVRFRLSAERVGCDIFKFDPVHSKPSSTFSQDLPGMPWNLNVFGLSGDMLCVNFQWSLLQRSCRGLLWACLDIRQKPSQNPEEEVPEAAGETSEDEEFNVIGGIPVFWTPASELRTLYGHYSSYATGDARDVTPSELMSKACAKTNEASCVGMIPLPKSCRDMTTVRVRLQMSTRNAFGQTTWSQPFVKQIQADPEAEETEEKAAPVCTLHLQYPEWMCLLPGDDEMLEHFSPRVVLLETSAAGAREVVLLDKAQSSKTDARFVFTVQGVLPKCLRLDSSTGIITWKLLAEGEPDDEPMAGIMDTFVIQVALLESWSDEQGFHAAASLSASAPMHLAAAPTAFGADDAAWDFLRSVLRGFVMEVLQSRGSETMQAASELLQDEELVEGFADICETLASDVGLAAYEVLMRVLELPMDYLELAAELDPDHFLDLVCVALDAADDEHATNSQGQDSCSDRQSFGGVEESDEGSESKEDDGLGSSTSENEELQMPVVLDGEVGKEVDQEMNLENCAKLQVLPPDGPSPPVATPVSASPAQGSTMLVGLTRAIAALSTRTGGKSEAARRSSITRSSGSNITARRASRAELQQLRRASHLKLDETADLEAPVSSNKLRSFRRMSSHLGSGTQNHLASGTHGTHNGDEVTSTRSIRHEKKDTPEVEISYPDLLPMWPAFEECEFRPSINIHKPKAPVRRRSIMHSVTHAGLGGVPDDSDRLRDSMQFSVSPGLPGQISMDETTGVIKGCPLMERVAGCTYTISVCDRSSGEVLAKCTILFAVAPAEVAGLCNVAFRGQEVSKPGLNPLQAKPSQKGYPAEKKDAASEGQNWVEVTPRRQPWARVQPPPHSVTAGPSPVRPWMTVQQALNASLTKHSSRQGVIQLGPPLKDRDRNRKDHQSSTPRGAYQQLPPVNIARTRN